MTNPTKKNAGTPRPPTEEIAPQGENEAAFHRLKPELDALSESELESPRVDVRASATAALGVYYRVSEPTERARFEKMRAAGFDVSAIDRLGLAARAAWHASSRSNRLRVRR